MAEVAASTGRPGQEMDIDDSAKSVMASSGTMGSVSASLHPLVIMNISEHWTRIRAQEGKPQQGKDGKTCYVLASFVNLSYCT